MARTPLAQKLIQICSAANEATAQGIPAEQILQERAERRMNRREFLERSFQLGIATGAATLLPGCRSVSPSVRAQRIIVIGAGLAGLVCAFRLKQAGLSAIIYEAANHLGGRCQTKRGFFEDGQVAERGGELIDTGHSAMRRLARQLGLHLDDVRKAERDGTASSFYFGGKSYSQKETLLDFQQIYPRLQSDLMAAGYPTLYDRSTSRSRELDQISVLDWINKNVPGGVNSRLGQLLDVAYTVEFGADASELSALNLLYFLGASKGEELQIFGESDGRFHIRGGNDQLISRLSEKLERQIETGTRLIAIARSADGSFSLTLESDSSTHTKNAEHVVLALPFSVLRTSVDYSRANFCALKQTAIQELGMGTNSKLQLQFTSRCWYDQGCNGETLADTGHQCTWDASRGQSGVSGILVDFTGGKVGAGFNHGTIPDHASKFLGQIEPVLPGISARWNRKTILDYWTGHRWSKGSYSYWRIGQYTRFAGIEGMREGNCHFAGEHTSTEFQGYLNGAVESGERAAGEILADLRGK